MSSHISLAEAASLLGLSKETLRNWDKSGKLKSVRQSKNNYRMYVLSDVKKIALEQPQVAYGVPQSLFDKADQEGLPSDARNAENDDKDLKRALAKVHRALRDTDGNSSIVERFDETTKLVFLKLLAEQLTSNGDVFIRKSGEGPRAYAQRLRDAFQRSARTNKALFPERFRELQLSDLALGTVGSILANVELKSSSQDIKGFAYEEMVKNTFDKGDNQQFFTPQPVVEFLVAALGDRLHGSICDPASGTGGFLVEVTKRGREYKKIVGFEVDERLAWVAGINLFVHGAKSAETHYLGNGGTLGKQGKRFLGAFDAIITNPPFGSDFTDKTELEQYVLGKGRTSRRRGILFIERCLEMLAAGGWLGIVIDEGVLSLPSAADVRELILQRTELAAVVSLPETAFMPYASVNTSILILRKNRRPPQKQITFYARVENVGRKANGDSDIIYDDDGSPRLNNDLPEILRAWGHFETTGKLERQTDSIFLAKPLALASDLSRTENRLDFRFHHPARISAEAALQLCEYELAPLCGICDIRNESYVPSVDFADQVIAYTGLAHLEPRTGISHQISTPANSLTSGVKKYYQGDILFARMRPNLRKVSCVDFQKPGYASAECVVFTVKKDKEGVPLIDPLLLSILLRSDYAYGQIIHLIAGIGRPRIALRDMLAIQVPMPPREHQMALREAFLKTRSNYESLRVEAKNLLEAAASTEIQAVEGVAHGFVRRR